MIINVLNQTREARNIVVQERLALLLAGGRGAEATVLLGERICSLCVRLYISLCYRQNKYLLSCRYSHFFAFAAE